MTHLSGGNIKGEKLVNFTWINLFIFKIGNRDSILTNGCGFTLWFAAQTSIWTALWDAVLLNQRQRVQLRKDRLKLINTLRRGEEEEEEVSTLNTAQTQINYIVFLIWHCVIEAFHFEILISYVWGVYKCVYVSDHQWISSFILIFQHLLWSKHCSVIRGCGGKCFDNCKLTCRQNS